MYIYISYTNYTYTYLDICRVATETGVVTSARQNQHIPSVVCLMSFPNKSTSIIPNFVGLLLSQI